MILASAGLTSGSRVPSLTGRRRPPWPMALRRQSTTSPDLMSTEIAPVVRRDRDEGARWRLVRALTGREVFASEHLERQGFVTFLPKQLKTVRHARKVRVALGAYFPGYLFVELDLARHRWRSVNGTLGVSHLVGSEDR